jgi:hypothetical protein
MFEDISKEKKPSNSYLYQALMFCYGLDLSADGVRYKEWSCRAGVTTIV